MPPTVTYFPMARGAPVARRRGDVATIATGGAFATLLARDRGEVQLEGEGGTTIGVTSILPSMNMKPMRCELTHSRVTWPRLTGSGWGGARAREVRVGIGA